MKTVGGISKNEHSLLHKHLVRKYGKPTMCEAPDCPKKPTKRYEWCLKKGHSYSSNREDYLQMCTSCHRKYDFNEGIRQKLKDKKYGDKHNTAKLTNGQVIEILHLIREGRSNKELAKMFGVHSTTICDIKRGKRWGYLTGIEFKKSNLQSNQK